MKKRITDTATAPYRGPRYQIGDKVRVRGGGGAVALVLDYLIKSPSEEKLGEYENILVIAFEDKKDQEILVAEEQIYKI